MKLIAKTEKGWLVDVTEDEIANVQGLPSTTDERWNYNLKPGDVFDVSKLFTGIYALANMSENLRQLGYIKDNFEKIEEYAKAVGIEFEDATKSSKYQPRR